MTFTVRLEQADGTPAEPPSFKTTVLAWSPGDQIPLGSRTLLIVRTRHDGTADEPPVLGSPEDERWVHASISGLARPRPDRCGVHRRTCDRT
jgi:hypothetical protein